MVVHLKNPRQRPGRSPPRDSDWVENWVHVYEFSCLVDPDFDELYGALPELRNGVIELHPDGLGNYEQPPLLTDTHPWSDKPPKRWKRRAVPPPIDRPRIDKYLLRQKRQLERVNEEIRALPPPDWYNPDQLGALVKSAERTWRTPGLPINLPCMSMKTWWDSTPAQIRIDVQGYTSMWSNGRSIMLVPTVVDPNLNPDEGGKWTYLGERTAPEK